MIRAKAKLPCWPSNSCKTRSRSNVIIRPRSICLLKSRRWHFSLCVLKVKVFKHQKEEESEIATCTSQVKQLYTNVSGWRFWILLIRPTFQSHERRWFTYLIYLEQLRKDKIHCCSYVKETNAKINKSISFYSFWLTNTGNILDILLAIKRHKWKWRLSRQEIIVSRCKTGALRLVSFGEKALLLTRWLINLIP